MKYLSDFLFNVIAILFAGCLGGKMAASFLPIKPSEPMIQSTVRPSRSDQHTSLTVGLVAENSSGQQHLTLTHDRGEYFFTLDGTYRGQKFQIDFIESTTEDLMDLRAAIDLMLEIKPERPPHASE